MDGNDFPFVKFADRDPRIGDWVIAVGNPFGLGGTVTAGVVSARGRDIGSGPYDDFIQIDAPVNKGNSGGPTFDVSGNVIGVNTAIFSPSGGSVGIGFDIPADTVKTVVAQLKDTGHVTRGWMGVQIQAVTADIADSLGLKKAEGALVSEPQVDSPAAKAGIMSGDVITTLDGNAVKDSHMLARKIGSMAPGTSVKLGVLHNGSEKTVTLTLGTLPDERQANAAPQGSEKGTPRLGLTLAPANAVGAGNQGVAVTAVDPNGPAAERGMQSGDVILDVAGKAVSNPADVTKEIANLHKAGKRTVLMRVKSSNGDQVRRDSVRKRVTGARRGTLAGHTRSRGMCSPAGEPTLGDGFRPVPQFFRACACPAAPTAPRLGSVLNFPTGTPKYRVSAALRIRQPCSRSSIPPRAHRPRWSCSA